MLPGWYGFGSAVEAFLEQEGEGGLDRLRAMHRRWPFLQALLSNMDMVLAKSDLGIASRYAGLVSDAGLRRAVSGRIEAEWNRSVKALLATRPSASAKITYSSPNAAAVVWPESTWASHDKPNTTGNPSAK